MPARPRAAYARALALLIVPLGAGCGTPPPAEVEPSPPSVLSPAELGAGWELLFDGSDLDRWRGYREQEVPASWSVHAGAIYYDGRFGARDLITRDRYGDFELSLAWRSGAGGNSGILFRVDEERFLSYQTGPEYQILGLSAAERAGAEPAQVSGANYDLHAPTRDVEHPPGHWNRARLRVRGPHVEHWLNGEKIVAYELWSDAWQRRVDASKFASWPDYGRGREGHIALQAHGSPIWFRDVRIRRLAE